MILKAPLLTFGQVLSEPIPPITWIVRGMLAEGDRTVWFGEYGALKSWLLYDLAIHLALGRPWLGLDIPRALKVLYVDEEMNERTTRRRLKRLALGLDSPVDPHVQDNLRFFSRASLKINAGTSMLLLHRLEKEKWMPDLVIVESLVRIVMGSENSATDIAEFWRRVAPLTRLNRTFWVSHHMAKGPAEAEGGRRTKDRARGSVDILAGADAGFAVEVVVDGVSSKIIPVKTRTSRFPPRLTFILDDNPRDENSPARLIRGGEKSHISVFSPPVECY